MISKKLTLILLFILSIIFVNCSEVKDDIAEPEELEGVHPDGFGDPSSDKFHSFKIQDNLWDMTNCQKCHAADYSGGTAEVTCLDCHSGGAGPEACNTCHGVFADESRIAPPTDINNNFATSARGVGAHTVHVYETEIGLGVSCYECHPGNADAGDYVASHSDGLPAEMAFGSFSSSGGSTPTFDTNDLTCANTYCHGSFTFKKSDSESQWAFTDSVIVGENFSPIWNIVDGTQAACGTCHLLPPTGHINAGNDPEAATCRSCHSTAYNEDGSLNKFNHINGSKNLN